MVARVEFYQLCLDVADVPRAAAFWSAALGLRPEPRGDMVLLRAAARAQEVWLNPVPEPRVGPRGAVKNRVHLDVHTAAVTDLLDLGATVLDDTQPWTVLADPDGGELCAFVRDEVPDYRLYELVVDAADPERIARWWGERFGVEAATEPDDTFWWLEGGSLPYEVVFTPVPEPKVGKNRVHWDVTGDTDELLVAGATLLRRRGGDIAWDVLADPEGNEFCVFAHEEG